MEAKVFIVTQGRPEMKQDEPNERVDPVFRNGTLTVVGIVLAFSLGFVSHWAGNPVPWQPYDAFALTPILIGMALQVWSISMLLTHECLHRPRFDRATRIFMAGLCLTGVGVGLAVIFDFLAVSRIIKML